jgi:hypothetical protein
MLMNPRYRTSAKRLCRVGVSLLLTVHAAGSLANKPLESDFADDVALVGYNEDDPISGLLARKERQSAECEAAVRRSLEIVPELLALASWPLDDTLPAECASGGDSLASMAEAPSTPQVGGSDPTPLDSASMQDTHDAPGEAQKVWTEAPPAAAPNPLGKQLVALGNESLDDVRGGFELADSNLKFSFGIERAVFINGELVSTTVLNLRDLQWTSGGKAPDALTNGVPGAAASVIQNGAGNSAPAQIGASMAGTVVQNTLNNQNIQTVTTINAAVNSAQVLRSMSVQSAVQNGVISSLRR